MVKITDIQVTGTDDEFVYHIIVMTDVVTGTDEGGNSIYLSFSIAWNKNTEVSVLYQRFVAMYDKWKGDWIDEEQVRTYLLNKLP